MNDLESKLNRIKDIENKFNALKGDDLIFFLLDHIFIIEKIEVPKSKFKRIWHKFSFGNRTMYSYLTKNNIKLYFDKDNLFKKLFNKEYALNFLKIIRESKLVCCMNIYSDYDYTWIMKLTFDGINNHKPIIEIENEDLILLIFKTYYLFLLKKLELKLKKEKNDKISEIN